MWFGATIALAGVQFVLCHHIFDKVGLNSYYIGDADMDNRYFDWFMARSECRAHNSQLVSIETAEEMSHLQDYIVSKGYANGSTFATSGNSFESENPYSWDSSGKTLEFTKWLPSEKLPIDKSYLSLVLIDSEIYMIRSEGYDDNYICESMTIWERIRFEIKRQFSAEVAIALILLFICYCFLFYAIHKRRSASYEFYKVSYKNRVFSVPIMMDWLHANFGCETLDSQARLITLQNADEMRLLVDYIRDHTHADTHPMFWSGGHRGRANDGMDIDHRTLIDFYWHDDYFPMNFTNFARDVPLQKTYSDGFCVSLEFTGNELIMGVASCEKRMSFVCELRLL
ncbi:uncharacterized protein Dwil_GK28181 [Drosophila willistoni]|uniref:C-type lectin domain-containing protein n=1 Tax=Drosophila willistoni TaxID=7260 RepID=A0A0Q9WXC4_DROWI|nr:uncharacterized protein Dwil_GK28181 [Drosophila willistoni]